MSTVSSSFSRHLRRLRAKSRWNLSSRISTISVISHRQLELLVSTPNFPAIGSVRSFARKPFVPRKAAVKLTEKARNFFTLLLENRPRDDIVGLMLKYQHSSSGEMRMVFSFDFVKESDIDRNLDESVSLELIETKNADGTTALVPKPPAESQVDGLPKLYIHHDAFLKVLGATVDVDTDKMTPILYDREGNLMDPNA